MQKFTINGKNFDLYTLSGNTSVMENTEESLTYNQGTDYFTGCDFITLNAYYVPKSETAKAILLINNFLTFIETTTKNENLAKNEYYMESFEDFSIFHKVIENSEYDIFLTHFDGNNIQIDTDGDDILTEFESFKNDFQNLSCFHIIAGADIDDLGLESIALGFFKDFQPEVFKDIVKSLVEDVNDFDVDMIPDFEDAVFVDKTNDKLIIQKFFVDYFSHVLVIENSDYLGDKIFNKIIQKLN